MQIKAPAKLNLFLNVGEKRPDGFHEIESLFLALDHSDTIFIEAVPEQPLSLEIIMDFPGIPPEKNIISRAVSLFRANTGYKNGLKISVQKRILPGSGLGGGSSNAAAVLLALNHLDSDGLLPLNSLCEIGAGIGSDVPFFISGASAAYVNGRGEHVQPLELPESFKNLNFILVNPGFPSNTTEAYSLLDVYRKNFPVVVQFPRFSSSQVFGFLKSNPQDWLFTNDFLPVLGEKEPGTVYKQIISLLLDLDAEFAGLSGSGSACFGIFTDKEKAGIARKLLLKQWDNVILTFPLAS